MNTKKLVTKFIIALSLLILGTMGLVGCGTIQVAAVNPEPEETGVVDMNDADTGETGLGEVGTIEIGIEPTPRPETLTYTNETYGFEFDYPETWSLTEEDHGVVLKKGTNRLGINFRWKNEDIHPYFGRTGMGAGDFIYADKINFMGQVIPAEVLLYEKKSKAVFYNGTSLIEVDNLVLMIVLEDLETDYTEVDLTEETMADARAILESFRRTDAGAGTEGTWATPTNEATVDVVGSSPGAGLPLRRTAGEAREMIEAYLRDQKPDLVEELDLPVEEITNEQVWEALQVQVFKVTGEIFLNESFLIRGELVLQLGTAIGGQGVSSLAFSDLDLDGQAEMLFTYSFGSGIHQTRAGMYAPAYTENGIYEADLMYLGDLELLPEERSLVALRLVEVNPEAGTSGDKVTVGYLAIEQEDGEVRLVFHEIPGLPDEIQQKIVRIRNDGS